MHRHHRTPLERIVGPGHTTKPRRNAGPTTPRPTILQPLWGWLVVRRWESVDPCSLGVSEMFLHDANATSKKLTCPLLTNRRNVLTLGGRRRSRMRGPAVRLFAFRRPPLRRGARRFGFGNSSHTNLRGARRHTSSQDSRRPAAGISTARRRRGRTRRLRTAQGFAGISAWDAAAADTARWGPPPASADPRPHLGTDPLGVSPPTPRPPAPPESRRRRTPRRRGTTHRARRRPRRPADPAIASPPPRRRHTSNDPGGSPRAGPAPPLACPRKIDKDCILPLDPADSVE